MLDFLADDNIDIGEFYQLMFGFNHNSNTDSLVTKCVNINASVKQ